MRASLLFLATLAVGCGGKTVTGEAGDDGGVTPGAETSVTPPDDRPPPPRPSTPTDKMDLLLVIDNSISMADKQHELARRLPELVRDLTVPQFDASGKPRTKAVADLHVGVITSSLGSHGTSACAPEITNKHNNDRGHLLPRAGEGSGTGFQLTGSTVSTAKCPAPIAASAIAWKPGSPDPGLATSCIVQSVKDDGCGYEETLEATYRFLVDPAPYASAQVKCTFGISGDACGNNKISVEGLDTELLAQRAAFLRPDSTVVVLVLSDENDASLKPAGLNWLPWGYGKGQMQRGWGSCANVPDAFEPESAADFNKLHSEYKCFSCFEDASDPNCKVKWATDPLNNDVDGRNLRSFQQVQRFGYNFLWGRQRYVDAFTQPMVMDSSLKLAPNPLFAGGRSPGNVLFAAIVGVPKQLVNGADGIPKPALTSADWDKIVGTPDKRDPHMIESIAPRPGVPHYAGDFSIDPINGGDRDMLDGDDLQYACIAPRATAEAGGYECEGPSPDKINPLCGPGGTQPRYKAYPGLRHLRVAKEVGGYVASICDQGLDAPIKGLVRRLQSLIK